MPELAVTNPTDANVLLYDGEELLGAKQNRILNITVLVAARSTTPIPVSCVEEGRWSRRSASFASAPHAAHPELRRRKAQRLAAEPLARGVAQSEVWDEVRAKSARMGVHSPTGAQADVFRSRENELRELERAFPLQPGQCGALLALGDDLCLDYVSRPEAFARLYPKLRAGYLLDALERLDGEARGRRRAGGFVDVDRRGDAGPTALGRPRRGRAPRAASASSAPGSSSTASCSSSAPSPATSAAGGSRDRAGVGEIDATSASLLALTPLHTNRTRPSLARL